MSRTYVCDEPTYVYVHISGAGQALYVGTTCDPGRREGQHRRTSYWWPEVADTARIGPFDKGRALEIEAEFQAALQPPFNTFGTHRDPRIRENRPALAVRRST